MSKLSRTSSQHTTGQATAATADTQRVTIRHHLVTTIDNTVVHTFIDSTGDEAHIVPSRTKAGQEYVVTVRHASGVATSGTCTCKAAQYCRKCHHITLAAQAAAIVSSELFHIAKYTNRNASGDDQRYGAELLARITWTPATPTSAMQEVA